MSAEIDAIVIKLKEIISERLGLEIEKEQIGSEDLLASSIGIDSMGFIELKFQCEEEFDIEIEEKEFDPKYFSNCSKLGGLIDKKMKEGEA